MLSAGMGCEGEDRELAGMVRQVAFVKISTFGSTLSWPVFYLAEVCNNSITFL